MTADTRNEMAIASVPPSARWRTRFVRFSLCMVIVTMLGTPVVGTATAGLYVVRDEYHDVLVRSFRRSWAVGTLRTRDEFDVVATDGNWAWGYAYGAYGGCAWTHLPKLRPVAGPPRPHQDCGPAHRIPLNASEHAPSKGYGGGRLTAAFSVKSHCDGHDIDHLKIYRNYRSGQPRDPYDGTLASHSPIGWRYTKGGNDDGYAMIRYDRGNKWGFVKRSCIAERGGTAAAAAADSADTFDGWNECETGDEDSELCVEMCGDEEVDPGEQCDPPDSTCGSTAVCRTCQCIAVSDPFPEGTFTRTPNGTVYRTAGRSPVQLFTCNAGGYYPGCPAGFWNAPQDFVDALRAKYPVPIDGAFIRRPEGTVFRFAGGAPVQLFSCTSAGYYPGCSGIIDLDGIAVDRLIQARSIPADGALLRKPDGAVFQMRCGRAEYVQSCSDVGGCNGLVDLDGLAVDQLVMKTGCQDGKPCTTDRCENLIDCRHDFAPQCLTAVLSQLEDDDTCETGSGDCDAMSIPIQGRKLVIKDASDVTQRSITFSANDPRLETSAIDPVRDGAALQIHNDLTEQSACLALPSVAGSWRMTGSPPNVGYKYRDTKYLNGPCNAAMLKRGVATVKCRARVYPIMFALSAPSQGHVDVTLTTGARTFCAEFGGRITVDFGTSASGSNGAGEFVAARAPAPASCAVPQAACSTARSAALGTR